MEGGGRGRKKRGAVVNPPITVRKAGLRCSQSAKAELKSTFLVSPGKMNEDIRICGHQPLLERDHCHYYFPISNFVLDEKICVTLSKGTFLLERCFV